MKRIIIFLIRKRLGLKKLEKFQFKNQKSKDNYYYFNGQNLMKYNVLDSGYYSNTFVSESHVSLNWLLNDECEIVKI